MVGQVLFSNPLIPGAMLIGVCGAAGLMLIYWYGQLGKMMLPAYAALFFALAYIEARHSALPWAARFTAVLLGFCIATTGVYALSIYSSARERKRRAVDTGSVPGDGMSLRAHVMRVGLIMAVGAVLSAIVVSTRG